MKDKFDKINELDMTLSEEIESQVKSRDLFEKKMYSLVDDRFH